MSQRRPSKSKLDLLVRLRYLNPIPPPTLPPLLIDIPTPIDRLADASFMATWTQMEKGAMVWDSEMGCAPLEETGGVELNWAEGIWGSGEEREEAMSKLNPTSLIPSSSLHPSDAALLLPASISSSSHHTTLFTSASEQQQHQQPRVRPEESWLRNTTYISSASGGAKKEKGLGGRGFGKREPPIDASELAQVQAIEKSFVDHDSFILPMVSVNGLDGEVIAVDPNDDVPAAGAAALGIQGRTRELRHPGKPGVKAVEVFDVLPDDEAWELKLTKMDYQERPSGTFAVRATDPQILTSLLKPHGHGRSAMMEFFMPDQENARIAHEVLMKDVRPPVEEGEEEMEERLRAEAAWVRDYSSNDASMKLINEVLLVFHDGLDKPSPSTSAADGSSTQPKPEEEEDDDDDIFGDKELAEEEKVKEEEESQAKAGEKRRREKGVYLMPIEMRIAAKRKRVNKGEQYERTSDIDALSFRYIPQDTSLDWYETITAPARRQMTEQEWVEDELKKGDDDMDLVGEGDGMGAQDQGVIERA